MLSRAKTIVGVVVAVALAGVPVAVAPSQAASAVRFAAVGDIGAVASTSDYMLRSIGAARPDFAVALGDLSYDQEPGDAWCRRVKDQLNAGAGRPAGDAYGEQFPFDVMLGNHDVPQREAFAACLPDRLGAVAGPSGYPNQYVVDYPPGAPLVRLLALGTVTLDSYSPGSPGLAWAGRSIDEARASGIPWVVVAVHENYVSVGPNPSQVPASLMTLLLDKRVDLVLQGHDHNYQRSKQLATGPACPAVPVGAVEPACVVGDGAGGGYVRGRGTIVVVSGTGGRGSYRVNAADPDAGYMATFSDSVYGWTQIEATPTTLSGRFVGTGGVPFTDTWTIGDGAPPPQAPDLSPPTAPADVAVDAVTQDAASGTTTVSWSPSRDDSGISTYRVVRNQAVVATVSPVPGQGRLAFADVGVPLSGTVTYRVVAVDRAGNTSPPSRSASVTLEASGGSVRSFDAVSDTTVYRWAPALANGSAGDLGAGSTPGGKERSYLRFDVSGLENLHVVGADLQVVTTDPSATGATLWSVAGPWDESTTWASSPPATTWLGRFNGSLTGQSVSRPVGSVVTGNGSWAFLLSSSSDDRVAYASRESGVTGAKLVVRVAGTDVAPPGPVTGLAIAAADSQRIDLTWQPATDDLGVTGYQIERDNALVTTRALPGWSDYGRGPGRAWTYRVRALDRAGHAGEWSMPLTVRT